MRLSTITKAAGGAIVFAAILFLGVLISPKAGRADNQNNQNNNAQDESSMIQIGMAISPVQVNLAGKDPDLVGLGSFMVNAVADCNGCHTSDPTGSEWAPANNPYLLKIPNGPFTGTIKVNPATYLAGGQSFGPFISRNLTPDYRGLPEGGHSLSDFLNIMQNGVDLDGIHPTCGAVPSPGCVPAPVDGSKLQVMPWAVFRNMTTRQLTAIWTYLSAIPCIDDTTLPGPPNAPNELRNTCSK